MKIDNFNMNKKFCNGFYKINFNESFNMMEAIGWGNRASGKKKSANDEKKAPLSSSEIDELKTKRNKSIGNLIEQKEKYKEVKDKNKDEEQSKTRNYKFALGLFIFAAFCFVGALAILMPGFVPGIAVAASLLLSPMAYSIGSGLIDTFVDKTNSRTRKEYANALEDKPHSLDLGSEKLNQRVNQAIKDRLDVKERLDILVKELESTQTTSEKSTFEKEKQEFLKSLTEHYYKSDGNKYDEKTAKDKLLQMAGINEDNKKVINEIFEDSSSLDRADIAERQGRLDKLTTKFDEHNESATTKTAFVLDYAKIDEIRQSGEESKAKMKEKISNLSQVKGLAK